VNTASRMQALCRDLGRRLVVSQPLVDRVRQEGGHDQPALARLCDGGIHRLRGRSRKIHVWTEAVKLPCVGARF
jgi:class 3 adenylate cyclase